MFPAVRPTSSISNRSGMARGEIVDEIRVGLEGDRVAVMLYGSCARGDDTARSDIDVLQLVDQWRPSYSTGRVSVSVYTCAHLLALARAGSLFILHLIKEGKPIEDPQGRLAEIFASYRQPTTYQEVHRNLCRAASVLDVDAPMFQRNPGGFTRVALYLLRTTLYVRCAAMGVPTFSMARVAQCLQQPWVAEVFRRLSPPTFDSFHQIRSRLLGGA